MASPCRGCHHFHGLANHGHIPRACARGSDMHASPARRTDPLSYLHDQLEELKNNGTYFRLRVLDAEQAPECIFDGKRVISLASNNYLGLTTHPRLRESAI